MRLALLALLVPGLALAGSESSEQRAKEADGEGLFSTAGMSFSVDDNVHRLSTEEYGVYKTANQDTNSAAQARFNRMVSVADTIYRENGVLYHQAKPFGDGFSTRLGVEVDYVKYYQNTIKDHPLLRGYARQYFTDKHYLEASFSNEPNQFERNYIGRLSGRRQPGSFYTRAARARYDGRFDALGGFDFGAWAQYSWDRYAEPDLEYRNAVKDTYGGSLGRRWSASLHTEAGYRYELLRAVGSAFSDRSHWDHQWYIKGEWVPWRDLHVTAQYRGSYARYLSRLSGLSDPFYGGRTDFIDEESLGASYPLGEHWEFWAEFSRAEKRSNLSSPLSDEFLRYTQDVYSLGVRTRWNFGWFSVDL